MFLPKSKNSRLLVLCDGFEFSAPTFKEGYYSSYKDCNCLCIAILRACSVHMMSWSCWL